MSANSHARADRRRQIADAPADKPACQQDGNEIPEFDGDFRAGDDVDVVHQRDQDDGNRDQRRSRQFDNGAPWRAALIFRRHRIVVKM